MTLDEAYEILGLKPLEEMLLGTLPGGRGSGSTTWMLVEAALHLHGGGDVMLVGISARAAQNLASECLNFFNLLEKPNSHVHRKSNQKWLVGNGTILTFVGPKSKNKALRGLENTKVFDDKEWARKARAKSTGPYLAIRTIEKTTDGRFLAYDEQGDFLLELAEEGARRIAEMDTFRIQCVKW